jgi:hypothetical protein
MSLERVQPQAIAGRIFGAGPAARVALMRACWRVAVGEDLASRTEVLALEGRTLRLRVPDARWRKVLHRMERELLSRLRQSAGELAPNRLGFTEGPVAASAPKSAPKPLPELRPLPAAVAASASSIADPEIRERFLETAARYLSRAEVLTRTETKHA